MFYRKFKIVLSLTVFILSLSLNATVYQTVNNGNWNDNSNWNPSKPNINWSNLSDTIIINHEINLNKNISIYGQTLIINQNAKLNGNKTINMSNGSDFINNGTLNINKVDLQWGNAYFENNGSIVLDYLDIDESKFVNNSTLYTENLLSEGDSLINSGNLTVNTDFKSLSSNYLYIENSGNLEINRDFKYYCKFNNSGNLTIGRNYTPSWGSVTNHTAGTISVVKDIEIQGEFNSNADVTIYDDAENEFELNINAGQFTVKGNFLNDWGSDLIVNSVISVEGDLNNRNTILNTGSILVDYDFTNKGSINNQNYISVGEDFDNHYFSSNVENTGVIQVQINLQNEGTIVNNGNLTVDGSANSNGQITGSGDLCHSDGVTDPTGGSKAITCNICSGESSALPVELTEFKAILDNEIVKLNWTTHAEENNKHFEVQYSTDAYNFETFEIVKGAANSTQINNYSAIHNNPEAAINYYRLKQVDFNGDYEYSDIVAVESNKTDLEMKIYPNPVNQSNELNIEVSAESQLKIYDVNGRLVLDKNIIKGNNKINTANLIKGYYIVKIHSSKTTITNKLVVN